MALPISLQEFNKIVENIMTSPARRGRTRAQVEADIRGQKDFPGIRESREEFRDRTGAIVPPKIALNEARKWERAGMNPVAARIAAKEQLSKMTPEDWQEVADKLFR
jgi:hypothetical protein